MMMMAKIRFSYYRNNLINNKKTIHPTKKEHGQEGQCDHEYMYDFEEEMNRIEFKDFVDDDEFEEKQHFKKTEIKKDDKNNINSV